jgi:uncharacterized cupin superfamily protein
MAEVADGVFVSRSGEEAFESDDETGGRVHVLRDDDDVQAGIWEAPDEPGSGMSVEFDHHETIYVLAGRVEIDIEGGPTFRLGLGDMASFRKGVRSVWRPEPGFREVWVYG